MLEWDLFVAEFGVLLREAEGMDERGHDARVGWLGQEVVRNLKGMTDVRGSGTNIGGSGTIFAGSNGGYPLF